MDNGREAVNPRIVVMAKRKGGVGATNLAVNLAVTMQLGGLNTLVLDTDPQKSAYDWYVARKESGIDWPNVVTAPLSRLLGAAQSLVCDLVVVDCPPALPSYMDTLLPQADLVVAPCRPSLPDLQAHATLGSRCARLKVTAYTVLTMCPVRGPVADDAAEALAQMPGISVVPLQMKHRVAYSHSYNGLQGVLEYEPASRAADEVKDLTVWLTEKLEIPWPKDSHPSLLLEEKS